VADRAEEWRVTINGDGTVRQVRHALPESRPGAKLARDAAQALAEQALREHFGLDPAALTPVGAEQRQRPDRTDWIFAFADPQVALGKDGEARLLISIAGDETVGYGRFVHVPEAWQRAEREREGRVTVVRMGLAALLGVGGIAAVIMAVIRWTRGQCDRRALRAVAALLFVLGAVAIGNGWPQMAMNLNTTEPIASVAIASAVRCRACARRSRSVCRRISWSARQRASNRRAIFPIWQWCRRALLPRVGAMGGSRRDTAVFRLPWTRSRPGVGCRGRASSVVAVGLLASAFSRR
jgi:hypothetical protein